MEHTEVVIVGAGPSGLILALLLAKFQVKSIILEKEWEVQEDPRGMGITGDGMRTVYGLNLGKALESVSQAQKFINFHMGNFKNRVYMKYSQDSDWGEQCLPPTLFISQPKLEKEFRARLEESPYCEIRTGCEVTARRELSDGVIVEYVKGESDSKKYTTEDAKLTKQISAQWLVGADGKKGIVRKKFLEPVGIVQKVGKYEYTGTWIAVNLKITLPTPETHPGLPVWKIGVLPEQLYDVYWPLGWHFCTHPTQATATGRFGIPADRTWRYEFSLEEKIDNTDAEQLFWKHITPAITRGKESFPGLEEEMIYPRDCIDVQRCRPFTFVQKVAEPAWHHNRTIIIGDAAHVFPPFGGQGIASGLRDSVGLSWRLATLVKGTEWAGSPLAETLLSTWYRERRKGVDDSADLTMVNGRLANQASKILTYLQIVIGYLFLKLPWLLRTVSSHVFRDDLAFKGVEGGFFLADHGGGGKISQIYVRRNGVGKPLLSDEMLHHPPSLFTVIAICPGTQVSSVATQLISAIKRSQLYPLAVSQESICFLSAGGYEKGVEVPIYTPSTYQELLGQGITPLEEYNEKSIFARLGTGTNFAIIRPDTYIFCTTKSINALEHCLGRLRDMLGAQILNPEPISEIES